jgi:hypothetical protein
MVTKGEQRILSFASKTTFGVRIPVGRGGEHDQIGVQSGFAQTVGGASKLPAVFQLSPQMPKVSLDYLGNRDST